MPSPNDAALGTQTIARLLHVAPRTVSKLIDSGRLRGYRIPGSKTRRCLWSDLLKFCLDADLPEGILAAVQQAGEDPDDEDGDPAGDPAGLLDEPPAHGLGVAAMVGPVA